MADTSRVPLLSVEGLKKYYTAKSGMFSRSAGAVSYTHLGMEGLRKAKMSYCPIGFARKYMVRER